MVHGGDHGHDGLAVGKGEDRDFGAFEEFLNDNPVAAFSELMVEHHGAHGVLGLGEGIGNDDTLSEREPVRLDDAGHRGGAEVIQGGLSIREDLIARCGNAVLFHEFLGEHFARFDDGGITARAETGNAERFEAVDEACGQRVVGRDDCIINPVIFGKLAHTVQVHGGDGGALGVRSDPTVSGKRIQFINFRAFFQRADDGMFTSSAADNHNLHEQLLLSEINDGTGADRQRP